VAPPLYAPRLAPTGSRSGDADRFGLAVKVTGGDPPTNQGKCQVHKLANAGKGGLPNSERCLGGGRVGENGIGQLFPGFLDQCRYP
jgi:hypothetical protein